MGAFVIVRRALLALALCLSACVCTTPPAAPPPDWNELGPVVDIHCHVFNGRDLPIAEWLRQVKGVPRWLGGLVEWYVDWRAEEQPPPLRRHRVSTVDAHLASIAPTVSDAANPTEAELKKLVDFSEVVEKNVKLRRELESLSSDRPVEESDVETAAVKDTWTWALLLTLKRANSAAALASTYVETELFTPSIVDMNCWFIDQDPGSIAWSFAEQKRDMLALLAAYGGRMLPFLAFDPERELQLRRLPGELKVELEALANQGFVGVKIYPPFGYRPHGNAEIRDDHECGVTVAPARRDEYDAVLEDLYAACEALELPIAAHCEDPGAGVARCGEHADPKWWAPVLAKHPELRLNLTHFGGVEGLVGCEPEKSWARAIGELMKTAPHLYADVGAHEVTRDTRMCKEFFDRLEADIPQAVDRLMFGTDWHMIVRHEKHREYAARYLGEWQQRFGLLRTRRFARENALDYLGLSLGPARGKNRDRVEALFLKNNWTLPAWIQ
jgi:predicted TIM-barrel fold metal-dependent hydrolase